MAANSRQTAHLPFRADDAPATAGSVPIAHRGRPRHFLYMIKQPLVERDFERFGIGYLLDRGHRVTVLDLSDLIHPDLPNDRRSLAADTRLTYRVVDRRTALERERATVAQADLVVFLIQGFGLSQAVLRPLRLVARARKPYMIQCAPTYPGWFAASEARPRGDLRTALRWLQRRRPVDSLLCRIPPALLGIPTADFAVRTGSGHRRRNNLIGPRTREITTHAHDYDIFLREQSAPPQVRDQAVFIDQFFPFHHDHNAAGNDAVDAEAYYGTMNRLFGEIERKLGLQVVIASHPRARYAASEPLFEGRQTISGRTARLVLESRLVIAHMSVATAYAVMAHKPLLLVTMRDLERCVPGHATYCQSLARELGRPLLILDDGMTIDPGSTMAVDHDAYDRYLATYTVCKAVRDKPSWQVVEDEVQRALG